MFLTLNDGRKDLFQWDINVKANVDVECSEVHFSNVKYGTALSVEVTGGEVEIPNQLLIYSAPIYCWAFIKDNIAGYTKAEQTFDVIKRPKPSDYVYTQTEVLTVEAVVENAIREAVESGDFKGDPGYTPVKGKDYYTEADKAEMVTAVLAALPNGDEVAY